MRHFITFCLIMLTFGLFAQTQTLSFSFPTPTKVEQEDGFSRVEIENCFNSGAEGMPDLPFFPVSILLNPGEEIVDVIIDQIEFYPTIENAKISPREAYFPISKGKPEGYKTMPNAQAYNSNAVFPETITSGISTSFLCGHALGSFLICPARYFPKTETIQFVKNITLRVETQSMSRASESLKFLRQNEQISKRIALITGSDNVQMMNEYKSITPRNNANYDFLIITTAEFAESMGDLVAHKQRWGYKVVVKTVEDICSEFQGTDKAQQVRNCIIDYYLNEGISYVLFFGDSHDQESSPHAKIPMRKFYSTIDRPGEVHDKYLPSDMYFACLDGSWNEIANSNWGEPGEEDINHEISVGRICADNVEEIQTFINKLILYQDAPVVDDIKKLLMVGEQLDGSTYGGTAKDKIISGGNADGFTAAAIPSEFSISKLYERDGYWEASDLLNKFNNEGVHIVNHLGHSNVNFNMKLYNNDITTAKITNDGITRGFFIVYSQGCYNGSFDNHSSYGNNEPFDCINEMFQKIPTGAVANIGNSRYGWYSANNNGPSQLFDRTFFHAIFGEHIFNIGDANAYSKDKIGARWKSDEYLRWCAYELNLMGDPSMEIWTDTPTAFEPSYPDFIVSNSESFSVQTGVAFARVSLLQENNLIGRAVCNAEGNAVVIFDNEIDYGKNLTISITGTNKIRYENIVNVSSNVPVENLFADVDGLKISLRWKKIQTTKDVMLRVKRNNDVLASLPKEAVSYEDLSEKEDQTFVYCVEAVYDDGTIMTCISVTSGILCNPAGNLQISSQNNAAVLTWTAPSLIPDSYQIHRNGAVIKILKDNLLTYSDPIEEEGDFQYCVVCKYKSCESEPICEEMHLVNIEEEDNPTFFIAPNPARDYLTIFGTNMNHLVIYNIAGQKLYEQDVNNSGSETVINVAEFVDGMYFLQIFTADKMVTKRFVVSK